MGLYEPDQILEVAPLTTTSGASPASAHPAYALAMPVYEFRCRTCGATFTQSRPMAASSDPANCPEGHDDTARLLTVAAAGGRSAAMPAPSGGGCCGGSCGCG